MRRAILACISAGGPTRFIRVKGRLIRFEMHPVHGPWTVNADDSVAANQPSPEHPFWDAVTLWDRQGRELDAGGLCVWHHEPRPITRHVGGRDYVVVGYEDPVPGG